MPSTLFLRRRWLLILGTACLFPSFLHAQINPDSAVFSSGQTLNVMQFGAKGDLRLLRNLSLEKGSFALTSPTAQFTENDVGKYLEIASAQEDGTPLITTVKSVAGDTANLASAAGATIQQTNGLIGSDDAPAFRAAMAAAVHAPRSGGTVYIPTPSTGAGYFLVTPGGEQLLPGDNGTIQSCCGQNMPPEPSIRIPFIVGVPEGVRLVGDAVASTLIYGTWIYGSSSVDASQPILFRLLGKDSSYADLRTYGPMEFRDLQIRNSFIGIFHCGILHNSTFERIAINATAFPMILNQSERNEWRSVSMTGDGAGIVIGGWWTSRDNRQQDTGGWADKNLFERVDFVQYRTWSKVEVALDRFFDQYFYKSENSERVSLASPALNGASGISRRNGLVVATLPSQEPVFIKGAPIQVDGVADRSFNGRFTVVETTGNTVTWQQAGQDAKSGSGTIVSSQNRAATAGDGRPNLIGMVPYAGVVGDEVVILSRYGRPSFNNVFTSIFYGKGFRHPIYGGPEYGWTIQSLNVEGAGYADPDYKNILGVEVPDPYHNGKEDTVVEIFRWSGTSTINSTYGLHLAARNFLPSTQPASSDPFAARIGISAIKKASPDLDNESTVIFSTPSSQTAR